jgi:hypothetical protein
MKALTIGKGSFLFLMIGWLFLLVKQKKPLAVVIIVL